jgi:ribosomal protein L31
MPILRMKSLNRVCRRWMQINTHPTQFRQRIFLSNGSSIETLCISPSKVQVALSLDSLNHPSWNPQASNSQLIDEQGKIAKFTKKFNEFGTSDLDLSFGSMIADGVEMMKNQAVSVPEKMLVKPAEEDKTPKHPQSNKAGQSASKEKMPQKNAQKSKS